MQIKQRLKPALVGCAVLMVAELQAGPGFTGEYQFTMINLPDTAQILVGPNEKNELTGYYLDENGSTHGFLWRSGVLTDLDAPGMINTTVFGINDAGTVIGNYDGPQTSPCFLYGTRNGKWTVLPDVPGKPLSFPGGISNNGKALGYAFEDDFSSEVGWIWDGFSYSLFTLPGVEVFIPTAINNHAQVIGYYQDSLGSWHGFLKDGDKITAIDAPVPGTTGTFAVGLNNKGNIAGTYYGIYDGVFENRGFVIHDGTFVTVDVTGVLGTQVWGINDRNQLAGFTYDDTSFQAFVATPSYGPHAGNVPE